MSTQTARDPRVDPQPGDVVHYRSQVRTVGQPDREWVTFTWHKPNSNTEGWRIVHRTSLDSWRKNMAAADAIVLSVAS